jgi:hypothetical protein
MNLVSRISFGGGINRGSRTTSHSDCRNLQLRTRASRTERLISTDLSEHKVDPLLVFHKRLVRLVFIHSIFTYHEIHSLFNLDHEAISALIFTQLNPELRARHFLSCPVDVEIHDLDGSPTAGNRPNSGSNELFNDVTAPKYSAGEMKSTLVVSNPHCPVIEFGSVHRS